MGYQTDIGDMVLEQSEKPVKIYSPIISRWGNGQVAELDRRYPIFGGEVKETHTGSRPVLTTNK